LVNLLLKSYLTESVIVASIWIGFFRFNETEWWASEDVGIYRFFGEDELLEVWSLAGRCKEDEGRRF
jgi:hypothetical protein